VVLFSCVCLVVVTVALFPPSLAFLYCIVVIVVVVLDVMEFLFLSLPWCCFVLPWHCCCHVIGIVVVDATLFVFFVAAVSALLFFLLLWHCCHNNNIFKYNDTFYNIVT